MVEIVGWVERMRSVGNFGLCYICMYLCKYCDRIVPWNSLVHFLASSHLLTKAGERGTVGHTTNLFTGSRSQEDKRSGHCHCKEQEPLKIVEKSNNDSDKLLEKKIFLYILWFYFQLYQYSKLVNKGLKLFSFGKIIIIYQTFWTTLFFLEIEI